MPWNKQYEQFPSSCLTTTHFTRNTCIIRSLLFSEGRTARERSCQITICSFSWQGPRSPPVPGGEGRWGTTHRILPFVVGFSEWTLFCWQKAVVSIPVKTSGSKATLLIRLRSLGYLDLQPVVSLQGLVWWSCANDQATVTAAM